MTNTAIASIYLLLDSLYYSSDDYIPSLFSSYFSYDYWVGLVTLYSTCLSLYIASFKSYDFSTFSFEIISASSLSNDFFRVLSLSSVFKLYSELFILSQVFFKSANVLLEKLNSFLLREE